MNILHGKQKKDIQTSNKHKREEARGRMEIAIIVILAVLLVVALWKCVKWKLALTFYVYYMKKHNIQIDEVELEKVKREVTQHIINDILHKS